MGFEKRSIHPAPVEKLIRALKEFREIGPKMAERLSYEIIKKDKESIDLFINTLSEAKASICFCDNCRGYSINAICDICNDESREKNKLCIVESPDDILAVERTGIYRGLYYSLSDNISVSRGKGLDKLVITDLIGKIKKGNFIEIIIATNTDMDGELAANVITSSIKNIDRVKISRLAFGLPVGSGRKLADSMTLKKSFEGRNEI